MPLLSTFGAASARSFGGIGAAAAGATLDIDEAFSTYLYEGTGSAQTITNGVDLSGEGGLVWIKNRDTANGHNLEDTERGAGKSIYSNTTDEQYNLTGTSGLSSFNSNGFSITGSQGRTNTNGNSYAAWTFRKAPKFFDIVQFTNSTGGDEDVSHNLGAVPAMIIGKRTDTADNWMVWHIGTGMSNGGFTGLGLDNTGSAAFTGVQSDQGINSNTFNTGYVLSNDGSGGYSKANQLNGEYVFYLFAHNNGDGEFGPDADQDVIKCGSYTGVSATEISVNLGFEPQWVMIKRATGSSLGVYASWFMQDVMRGMVAKGADAKDNVLYANQSQTEGFRGNGGTTSTEIQIHPNATGFTVPSTNSVEVNQAGETYIYMAIRRGPLAEPTSATDVFAPIAYTTTDGSWQDRILQSNFTTDLAINGYRNITDGGTHTFVDRLRGYANILRSHQTNAESVRSGDYYPWPQTGQSVTSNEWSKYNAGNGLDYYNYQWKRAPGYFDVVGYVGAGAAQTVNHNLGVVPEMMWIKNRDSAENWAVYHSALGTSKYLHLNTNDAALTTDAANRWNNTSPTATQFSVGTSTEVSHFTRDFIAYLFATVAGISKVGSYTGNGSSQTIDCGFSSGARFVLIKSSTQATEWNVFDTARGIVSGNDPALFLDNTSAEVTNGDFIDPHSSGFTINYVPTLQGCNTSGQSYIFYAIA